MTTQPILRLGRATLFLSLVLLLAPVTQTAATETQPLTADQLRSNPAAYAPHDGSPLIKRFFEPGSGPSALQVMKRHYPASVASLSQAERDHLARIHAGDRHTVALVQGREPTQADAEEEDTAGGPTLLGDDDGCSNPNYCNYYYIEMSTEAFTFGFPPAFQVAVETLQEVDAYRDNDVETEWSFEELRFFDKHGNDWSTNFTTLGTTITTEGDGCFEPDCTIYHTAADSSGEWDAISFLDINATNTLTSAFCAEYTNTWPDGTVNNYEQGFFLRATTVGGLFFPAGIEQEHDLVSCAQVP